MDPVLDVMIEAARAGGEVALRHFRRGVEATLKADRSPVTDADHETEATIIETLEPTFPEYGVLGEESGARGSADRRFIVDPIDGTRNFARGIPIWAVMLALEERGRLTDTAGAESLTSGTALASNGLLHEVALRLFARPCSSHSV